MSLKQRALRGATWAVAGGNASQVLAFIFFIAISRMVGPAAFGTVAIAIAIVELCRPLAHEAMVGNLVASGKFQSDAFNAGFAISMIMGVALFLLLWLAAPLLAYLFRTPDLGAVLPQIALLLIFYSASRVQEAHLTLDLRFGSLATRSVIATVLGGGVGLAAASFGLGVEALIWQQWTSALVSVVLLWIACPWRPRFAFSRDSFNKLARSGAALAPAGIVAQLSLLTDALAVASFNGAAAAGVYNLGKRMRLALQLGLSTALDRVSLPAFARVKTDPAQLARTLEAALRLSTLVAFPVFIGVAAIGPELIGLMLGPEWAGAATPLTLLLIGGAVAMTTHYFDNILLVLDRRRWLVALRLFMLGMLLAGIVIAGPHGPSAVATAALIATLSSNIAGFFAVSRVTTVTARTYLIGIAVPLGISLAMLALLMGLRQSDTIGHLDLAARMLAFCALGAIFYAIMSWLLARTAVRALISAARTVLAS